MTCNYKVGEVIRVEYDTETGSVRVVLEILDPAFKTRILHSKDIQDVLVIQGKDAMAVASNMERQK